MLPPLPNVSGTQSPAAHLRQRMYPVTTAASLYLKCLTELSPHDMLLSVRIISLCFYLSVRPPPPHHCMPWAAMLPVCPSRCEDRLALCAEASSSPSPALDSFQSCHFSLSLPSVLFFNRVQGSLLLSPGPRLCSRVRALIFPSTKGIPVTPGN